MRIFRKVFLILSVTAFTGFFYGNSNFAFSAQDAQINPCDNPEAEHALWKEAADILRQNQFNVFANIVETKVGTGIGTRLKHSGAWIRALSGGVCGLLKKSNEKERMVYATYGDWIWECNESTKRWEQASSYSSGWYDEEFCN